MKKTIMIALFTVFASFTLFAQGSPPPPPEQGKSDDQNAPIGSGIGILLLLGAAYGAKKVFDARKKFKN